MNDGIKAEMISLATVRKLPSKEKCQNESSKHEHKETIQSFHIIDPLDQKTSGQLREYT